MAVFIPKSISDQQWRRLEPNKGYAIRCQSDDRIYLKLGVGKSFYISIVPFGPTDGHTINSIHFETGEEFLVHNLLKDRRLVLGRSSDVDVKIMHAIISRRHMIIEYHEKLLMIMDLGSVNGTYCHVGVPFFCIDDYLEVRPLGEAKDQTLDEVHQIFGATLDDFLKYYIEQKENYQNDANSGSQESTS